MSKWKSKPTIVEAFQWTGGGNLTELPVWLVDAVREGEVVFRENIDDRTVEMRVTTIQGQWVYAKPGEWIIPESVPNRFYPCADEVFRAKYEPADG